MVRQTVVPSERLELAAHRAGHDIVVGIDEVGRGAWAGPLIVGAVVLPANRRLLGLRDSKLLPRLDRERLARRIKRTARAWSIGIVDVREMNEIGLAAALGLAARRAIDGLGMLPTLCLVDGKYPFRTLDIEQRSVVKGDVTVRCIAAASVVAKVERDRMMRTLHRHDASVRHFRFDLNKGYPAPVHRQALVSLGPTSHHRTCFTPIRELIMAGSQSGGRSQFV